MGKHIWHPDINMEVMYQVSLNVRSTQDFRSDIQ